MVILPGQSFLFNDYKNSGPSSCETPIISQIIVKSKTPASIRKNHSPNLSTKSAHSEKLPRKSEKNKNSSSQKKGNNQGSKKVKNSLNS